MSDAKFLSNSPALRTGATGYEYLKKQARKLQRAARAAEPEAIARIRAQHPKAEALVAEARLPELALSDAQLVIAREHGFISWPKLKTAILALSRHADESARLEALVGEVRGQLQRFARLTGRLSRGQLRAVSESDDPQVLIDVASDCFDRAEREALLEHDARIPRLEALHAALERVMDGREPEPVGSGAAAQSAASDASACLVVLYAGGYAHLYGRRFMLDKDVTRIGRNVDQDVVFNSDAISRTHCTVERRGDDYYVVDQGATNHTFVNAEPTPITSHRLRSGDRIATGDAILAFLHGPDLDAAYREAVDYIAERDGLTEVDNARSWTARLAREVLYARGCEQPLSLLAIDVDGLAKFNEIAGALAGNGLLRDLAHRLRAECGADARVGRLDGDLFVALLPGVDEQSALALGERVRAAIEAAGPASVPPSRGVEAAPLGRGVTVSVGVSTLYRTTGADELVADARAALALAKAAGRNCVRGSAVSAA